MPTPVTIAESEGVPVINTPLGTPMTPVEAPIYGMPITIVEAGGFPVHLVNDDLSDWSSYDPAAETLFARFTTPPTTARKGLINDLIVSLKDTGVWGKLDGFWVLAAADAQAAQRNWKADAFNITAVASPTFTADQGYDFNGTTQYLRTNLVPSTAGGVYVQDSAHASVWCRDNVQGDGYALGGGVGGGNTLGIIPRRSGAADTVLALVNGNTTTGTSVGSVATSVGLTHVNRSTAALTTVYKNGVQLTTHAIASTGLPAHEVYLGCRNNGGTPTGFDTRQIACATIGSSLTAPEALDLYDAVQAYLAAIGAA